MLKARVVKTRREWTVDVSLDLEPGASLALFGASGAGKSTVLSCLAGIETPDDGFVEVGEVSFFPPPMPLHKRHVGHLTQEPDLFPHLRVRENITFGLPAKDLQQAETAAWIATLRDRLQLQPVWEASAASISGGQARRVSLARMLAPRPKLVMLDEPFAGLDRKLVRELIDDLVFWNQTLGFSLIVVDHDIDVLRRLCPDDVIVIEAGRVEQRGSWAELYRNPATPLLRSLLQPL